MRPELLALLWLAALPQFAVASEEVRICYNYGCLAEASVAYDEAELALVRDVLAGAEDAARERAALSFSVGRLYAWAGERSPVGADKGGNLPDGDTFGRMDCIDHSTSTTRLLRMIEARGWLRFHRVLDPVRRSRFLLDQHFSAAVEETGSAAADPAAAGEMLKVGEGLPAARFAVDSWFFDNGTPAVVMPLEDWLSGDSPDV
jgi:hypothetical protein